MTKRRGWRDEYWIQFKIIEVNPRKGKKLLRSVCLRNSTGYRRGRALPSLLPRGKAPGCFDLAASNAPARRNFEHLAATENAPPPGRGHRQLSLAAGSGVRELHPRAPWRRIRLYGSAGRAAPWSGCWPGTQPGGTHHAPAEIRDPRPKEAAAILSFLLGRKRDPARAP